MNMKEQNKDQGEFEEKSKELIDLAKETEQIDLFEIRSSWKEVEMCIGIQQVVRRKRWLYAVSVAASVVVLTVLYFYVDASFGKKGLPVQTLSWTSLEDSLPNLNANEVLLISSKEEIQLKNESSLSYGQDGSLNVNHKNVAAKKEKKQIAESKSVMNQIIVPKGRRANITFSDGTKMYINAGSRVIYPPVFSHDKREIMVDGEVFLDVTEDETRPFIVKTKDFGVKVLGTRFNICAYKEDQISSVVLVSGKVEVETNAGDKDFLQPNQMIEVNNENFNKKNVDVYGYICWIDNIMELTGYSSGKAFDRLARYYGQTILYDEAVKDISVSGKLELKGNLEDAVDAICVSLSLTYRVDKNGNLVVSSKK